jgi:periplasmic divalent cation tolerance protein
MNTGEFALVLTTIPVDFDAAGLASKLVSERLAACVNILPAMRSVYRWKGAVEQADECQLIMKTTVTRLVELQDRLQQLHPYDVPEMLVLPIVGGGDAYLTWLRESCQ